MKKCPACPARTPRQVLAVAPHTSLLSAHMAPRAPVCSALTAPGGPGSAPRSHGPVVPGLLRAHSAVWSRVCSALTVPRGPHFVQRSKRPRGGKSAFRSHSWVRRMKPRVMSWAPLAPGPTEASAQAPSRGGLPASWELEELEGLPADSTRPALAVSSAEWASANTY